LVKSVEEKFQKLGMEDQVEEDLSDGLSGVERRARENSSAMQKLIGQRSKMLAHRKTKTAKRLSSINAALNPEQQSSGPDQNTKAA
jgi:hypothetical protein